MTPTLTSMDLPRRQLLPSDTVDYPLGGSLTDDLTALTQRGRITHNPQLRKRSIESRRRGKKVRHPTLRNFGIIGDGLGVALRLNH
jgi:hypothetical protein